MEDIIKKNLEKLKKENENYKYAQKISKLGSWTLDIKKDELTWSDEIYNIFEVEKENFKVSYNSFLNAIHSQDRDMVDKAYCQSIKNKTSYSIEHRILTKNQRIKWVLENCQTEYDKKGLPLISYGTIQDITKEYELSCQLKRSNKKLERIQKTLNEYVSYIRIDIKERITDVSEAFCNISNYKKEELIGKKYSFILEKNSYKDLSKILSSKKNILNKELKIISKKKLFLYMETTISAEYNENEEFIGFICIKNDITSKKEFEKQQIQLFAQSKMASMGEMIGNISHQWRQPLSAISTLATGIKLKKEFEILKDKELLENLDAINTHTQYLSKTIDTFKNFLKANKVRKEVCIQKELNKILKILEPSILNNHITLINKINDMKKIEVTIIPDELSQVIINIVSNAKSALIEREIDDPWIKIDIKKLKNNICILIEDNAKGIEEKIIHRIFEPYFTTKQKNQGTGLGLYMSHRIVTESLKGRIYAQNTSNGVCFTVELPFY